MKIGFIGLGNVGGKLANNLIKSRYKLIVRDLDPNLSKKFKKKGAIIASSPKELAENSNIIITCLPSPKTCSKVMTAKNGVLKGLSKNKIWLEMSTTDQSEVKRLEDSNDKYIKILKSNFPSNFSLKGIKIAIDCANGAGYKSGPKLLKSLGAKVYDIGTSPNGININNNCGSTFPDRIKFLVKKHRVNLGIALDGDADRIILCDERGKIIDGDQIIAMLANRWKRKKILKGGVIGTLMSNYGLQNYLKNQRIKFLRAKVGDRYVKEKMQKKKYNLGGEQSGHIILGKFATTGDGLLVALEVLFSMRKGKKASELFNNFNPTPQILENVIVKDKSIINSAKCKKAILLASKLIKNQGRMLVRKSGTEPKIRIMGESDNKVLLSKCINIVKNSIK